MSDNILKFPVSTPEVAKMFGFFNSAKNPESETHQNDSPEKTVPFSDLPVANLPISEHSSHTSPAKTPIPIEEKIAELREKGDSNIMLDQTLAESKAWGFKNIFKKALPYLVIFVLGIAVYYFFLSGTGFTMPNFGKIFKPVQTQVTTKENALIKLENQDLAGYYAWVGQFYYEVSDSKVIDPNVDNSGNGLTNFQKYLLNLNPKSYDTLGLGMPDSQTISEGKNPLTGGMLTDSQKKIVEQYFDLEVASNRLALANLQSSGNVAGAEIINGGQWFRGGSQFPADKQRLNAEQNNVDINTDIPGRLEIPSLNVNVPLMWSKDAKAIDKDLQSGVVHYPGTAMPGEIGTAYISGHSSNYLWAKGDYNKIFSRLGDLADNTSFKITVVQKNGKDAILHYVVTSRKEFSPTDQEQFRNGGESVVALSTCWPVNTTAKRLVVFGKLTQVVK